MRSVRIELVPGQAALLIDVVCDCGRNGLTNEATGEGKFKHHIDIWIGVPPTILSCSCGKRYVVASQRDHIHVNPYEA
ncbi:hypothetical protein KBA73_05675 [Patescibacteria group bacterium]|nr:hypothetical protein [Patescibacteria group bacterium]